LVVEVFGTGTLESKVVVGVSSKIIGKVVEVLVDQGDTMTAGQTLAQLEAWNSQMADIKSNQDDEAGECSPADDRNDRCRRFALPDRRLRAQHRRRQRVPLQRSDGRAGQSGNARTIGSPACLRNRASHR
jgi:multidrug efflux pump subunit AcrA (membrane-fusion protein)